jgi:hypothetical protein
MAHWYQQERYRMVLEELERRRSRRERIVRLCILLSVAWILMLLSAILGYYLTRMSMGT